MSDLDDVRNDLMQLFQEKQGSLPALWSSTTIGSKIKEDFPKDDVDSKIYSDLIIWVNKVYGDGTLQAFITKEGKTNIEQWIKEAESGGGGGGGGGTLNPPDKKNPYYTKLMGIYTTLNKLNGYQDWAHLWVASTLYTPDTLPTLFTNLGNTLTALSSLSNTKEYKDMHTRLNQGTTTEAEYLTLATNSYSNSGVDLTLENFIWDLNKPVTIDRAPTDTILNLYNNAVKSGGDYLTKITRVADAINTIMKDSSFKTTIDNLNKYHTTMMTTILDPNSPFYTDLFKLLIQNPTLVNSVPAMIKQEFTNVVGANFVWITVIPMIIAQTANWKAFLTDPDATDEIIDLLKSQAYAFYNQLMQSPGISVSDLFSILNHAYSLGQDPKNLSSAIKSSLVTMVGEFKDCSKTLNKVVSDENSWETNLAMYNFQLVNAGAYTKGVSGIDNIISKINSLTSDLNEVNSKIETIRTTIQSIKGDYTTALGKRFQTIFGWVTPGMSEADFVTVIQGVETRISTLTDGADYKKIQDDINSLSDTTGIAASLVQADASTFRHYKLPNTSDPTVGLINYNSKSGRRDGIWFDVSRFAAPSKGTDTFQNQLEDYAQEMALNGITVAKLCFTQLNPNSKAKQADAIHSLMEALKDAGINTPFQLITSTLKKYGIDSGISVGGEDATGDTLTISGDVDTAAQTFYNTYGQYVTAIDFDLEGKSLSDCIAINTKAKMITFFQKLQSLGGDKLSIEVTLCGSVKTNAEPLVWLFEKNLIDKVNIMAYNNGSGAYLDPTNIDYGALAWINFLTSNVPNKTTVQAMKMLNWGGEDRTPYNDASKVGWNDYATLSKEVMDRSGANLSTMTTGAAFAQILDQLRIDTITDLQKKGITVDPTTPFGTAMWWVDSNRIGIQSKTLALYPESFCAAKRIQIFNPGD